MITMLELLEKIKDGTQPFSIVYEDEYYYWTDEDEDGNLEGNYVTVDREKLQMTFEKSIKENIYRQVFDIEPLISRKDRDYLKTVIEPFNERVKFITKTCPSRETGGREALVITYTGDDITESCCTLPTFESGTHFKEMELWKHYRLSDLHICFDEDDYNEADDIESMLREEFV